VIRTQILIGLESVNGRVEPDEQLRNMVQSELKGLRMAHREVDAVDAGAECAEPPPPAGTTFDPLALVPQ
jgi:hypothetical protein